MSNSEPEEGQQVVFAGPGWNEPASGRLLAIAGSAGHVQWDTGADAGRITLTHLDDLIAVGSAPPPARDTWSDSLEVADGLSAEAAMEGAIPDDEFLFGVGDEF